MRGRVVIILMIFFFPVSFQGLRAQPDADVFLRAGADDANKLIGAYLEPFARGVSASLVNGWYNTATTHRPLGFDITVMSNVVYIPDRYLTFDPRNLGLRFTELQSPAEGEVPTVLGSDDIKSTYAYNRGDGNTGTFNGPDGFPIRDKIGMQAIPVPMAQIGIGIFRNTDLKFRFTPRMEYEDIEFRVLGGAIMHSLSQYFNEGRPTALSVSALVGYTYVEVEYGITGTGSDQVTTPDGLALMHVDGWTIQGMVSKYLDGITFYAGAGYNLSSTTIDVEGTFLLADGQNQPEEELEDPVQLRYDQNGPRFTAGVQLELAIITIHCDYTFQKFNTLSAGLGLRVDWDQL